jgi:hypothetical protein
MISYTAYIAYTLLKGALGAGLHANMEFLEKINKTNKFLLPGKYGLTNGLQLIKFGISA